MRRTRQDADLSPERRATHPPEIDLSDLSSSDSSERNSRKDKIAQIRKSIAAGSYRVGSDQIATKLMGTMSEKATDGPGDRRSDTGQEQP